MTLKEKVVEIISETLRSDVYKAEVMVHSSRDRNITEILDEIRALCGVTIVNSLESRRLSDKSEQSLCTIKFFLTTPSLQQHLVKLALAVRKIDGVLAFNTVRVDKASEKKT